jgi:hypothetical protein
MRRYDPIELNQLVLTSDGRFPELLIHYSVPIQTSRPLMGHQQNELYRAGESEITKGR